MKNPPSSLADLSGMPETAPMPAAEPSAMAAAILKELEALLERLLRTGEGGSIDLRSLPLSPTDRDWMGTRLGRGELEIVLEAGGQSRITETGLPGVWWVRHHDEAGTPAAEFIEVAWVPGIVSAHPEDVRDGLERLKRSMD